MSSTSSIHHTNSPPLSPSADSESSTPQNESLATLLSSQILSQGEVLAHLEKLSDTQWALARHNLAILRNVEQWIRVTEARARGSVGGLR